MSHLMITCQSHKMLDTFFIDGEELLQQHNRRTMERRILIDKNMRRLMFFLFDAGGHGRHDQRGRELVPCIVLQHDHRAEPALL